MTSGPVSPELLAAVRPRLLVLRPPIIKENSGEKPTPLPAIPPFPANLPTFIQRESGAVTVLIYPDHLTATGFVDGREIVLPR